MENFDLRLIFHSIHNVMLAEELLGKVAIEIDMVPVPREISSDCGMCLACHLGDLDVIRDRLKGQPFTREIKIFVREESGSGYRLDQVLTPFSRIENCL